MRAPAVFLLALALSACGDAGDLIDQDSDGFFEGKDDCDDLDPAVKPGAIEVCDGRDNDCNGLIDDDADGAVEWFVDEDGDGYGTRVESIIACAPAPIGYAANDNDCNDHADTVYPHAPELCNGIDDDCDIEKDEGLDSTTLWYEDRDHDGFGGGNPVHEGCSDNPEWSRYGTDCNDVSVFVNPDANEICDSVDNDCDGLIDDLDTDVVGLRTWYRDADGDGFGYPLDVVERCKAPLGYVENAEDCDDTNAALNPGTQWFEDYDHDGYGNPDSAWPSTHCWQPIGYIDNALDCDDHDPLENSTVVWYADEDRDGWGANGDPIWTGCTDNTDWVNISGDCDDTLDDVNPDGFEICDQLDNDCDTLFDDDDPDAVPDAIYFRDKDGDGYGNPNLTTLACNVPAGYAENGADCNDNDDQQHPDTAWYRDDDRDGFGDPDQAWPQHQCAAPAGYIYNDYDCDDTDFYQHDFSVWYTDGDADGFGTGAVVALGCVLDDSFLSTVLGDCDDRDPNEASDLCAPPKLGRAHLSLQTDSWPGESTVRIECGGSVVFSAGPYSSSYTWFDYNIDLPAGDCQFWAIDSYGDGGAHGSLTVCGEIIFPNWITSGYGGKIGDFTMKACSGCTDPDAYNYDPEAFVDDGTCWLP